MSFCLEGGQSQLFARDTSSSQVSQVTLIEDIVIPGKHEIIQHAKLSNPILDDSLLEPSSDLMLKGIMVARAFVRPQKQMVPI